MIESNSWKRLLASSCQPPSIPGRVSIHEDTSGKELFAEPVIAPTEDYRKMDEHQLEHQQHEEQHVEQKESVAAAEPEAYKEGSSPGSDMSKTSIVNNDNLKTTYSAVTLDGLDGEDLPATRQQYASPAYLSRRPESTKQKSLYDTTASMIRLLATSDWGGIGQAGGDEEINLEFKGVEPPRPNSQVLPYNGSVIKADRLGTESDPLTKDFENYGTSGASPAFADSLPLLMDPDTVSSYSRDNSMNRNTTEHETYSNSTVDEPEPAGTFSPRGQEGEETFAGLRALAYRISTERSTRTPHDMGTPPTDKPTKGYSTPSLPRKKRTQAKSTYDGDFDPAGRTTGDHMITENPDNHGYLNLHSSVDNDFELEALCDMEDEVTADADPSLFNVATQPLGMAG
jgi:hypothetical protein